MPEEETIGLPVFKCSNGKWRIGTGPCIYKSKAAAERAYRAYQTKKHNAEMKEEKYIDQITLTSGHTLIMGHVPLSKLRMDQIHRKLENNPQDLSQFGLFDNSTPNYATYYPDVTPEDLDPKDEEFITPMFRLLSNVTVHPKFNPINFPADVLKKNMYKLIGQTVNIDHERAVGNAIGSIAAVEWQNAYKTQGLLIPAGINGILKIDGKSNPRIARGIMMDPPSIHSSSVTVSFAWKKSHPKLTDEEFWSKVGSYDDKGKLIQRVVVDITAFHENSLVSHGADPYAQKIGKDGKIVNPRYADSRYQLSAIELKTEIENLKTQQKFVMDWKQFSETETTIPDSINNNNEIQNSVKMEEYLRFLETLFKLEANSLTEENYQEELTKYGVIQTQALVDATKEPDPIKIGNFEGVEAITTEITRLLGIEKGIPADQAELIKLSELAKVVISDLKKETVRLYRLVTGEGKEDAAILAVIEGADYKTLQSLHKQYDKATEDEFKFKCIDCGSSNVTRASANPGVEEDKDKLIDKSNPEVVDTLVYPGKKPNTKFFSLEENK